MIDATRTSGPAQTIAHGLVAPEQSVTCSPRLAAPAQPGSARVPCSRERVERLLLIQVGLADEHECAARAVLASRDPLGYLVLMAALDRHLSRSTARILREHRHATAARSVQRFYRLARHGRAPYRRPAPPPLELAGIFD